MELTDAGRRRLSLRFGQPARITNRQVLAAITVMNDGIGSRARPQRLLSLPPTADWDDSLGIDASPDGAVVEHLHRQLLCRIYDRVRAFQANERISRSTVQRATAMSSRTRRISQASMPSRCSRADNGVGSASRALCS